MFWNPTRLTLVALGVALLGPPCVEAAEEGELRTWTSSVGTETEASLLGVRVLLKCRDGREIAVGIEQLSEADQEYVRQWIGREPPLIDQNDRFATLRVLVESARRLENCKKCRNDIRCTRLSELVDVPQPGAE